MEEDGEQPAEPRGLGILRISAAHFFAYFNPDIATTFTSEQQASMNATPEVKQATMNANQASNLGKNSGVSYWTKITAWMHFENWVVL